MTPLSALCVLALILANARDTPQGSSAALSTLQRGISIEDRWLGYLGDLPRGMMLVDSGHSVLIVHPNNLVGLVRITSPTQALEHVRFFTEGDRFEYFYLDGFRELHLDPQGREWGSDLVRVVGLQGEFRPPDVTTSRVRVPNQDLRSDETSEKLLFTIKRYAIFFDQNIYETTETLTEEGFYQIVNRRLVLTDVSRFGFVHRPG